MIRARLGIAAAITLGACTNEPGEVTVLFSFGEEQPPPEVAMHLSAWVSAEDSGERFGAVGPLAFKSALDFDFGNLPNRRTLVIGAEIRDGRWRNSRVLFHGSSDSFLIEPGTTQQITVMFEAGPWPEGQDGGPPPPALEHIVHRRVPFGANDTKGAERYSIKGTVAPDLRVVVFDEADVARATELGTARADASGNFELTLDTSLARDKTTFFIAALDGEDRLSDASSELEGLQASRVGSIAVTITAADDENAPIIDRAASWRPALTQLNLERASTLELESVRRRDDLSLRSSPEPIWSRVDRESPPLQGLAFTPMAYDSKRGVSVLFGGIDNTVVSGDTWEWDSENWIRRNTSGPNPGTRAGHSLAYDAARERVVLFGDFDPNNRETWLWDGSDWEKAMIDGAPPPGRFGGAMTYDSDRGLVMLFGGTPNDQDLYGDLWEWNGKSWMPAVVNGDDRPLPRMFSAIAYDHTRRRLLLFGGERNGPLNDLWSWDAETGEWDPIEVNRPPPARRAHAMAYDPLRDKLVVFGGDDTYFNVQSDVYEWDGSTWSQEQIVGPKPRAGHGMIFNPIAGGVVLAGGWDGFLSLADTWLWVGDQWIDRSQPTALETPSARAAAAATSDPARETAIMIGGTGEDGLLTDIWERKAGRWIAREPEPIVPHPSRRYGATMTYDRARGEHMLYGGVFIRSNQAPVLDPNVWIFDGTTWSERARPGPVARLGHASVWDDRNQRILVFGGLGAYYLNELWSWNGDGWTQLGSTYTPIPRWYSALAHDSARERTVMFGGSASDPDTEARTYFGISTFEWQQTPPFVGVWHETRTPTTSTPSIRDGHAMVYDPIRGNTVLFGGGTYVAATNETWIWDGATWTPRMVADPPPARENHAMVFDRRRGVVVMHGGRAQDGDRELDDMWEWNGETWKLIPQSTYRPSPRFLHAMSYDETRDLIFVFGGATRPRQLRDIWAWDGERWTDLTPPTIEPWAVSEPALAYDERSARSVLFGGLRESDLYSDDSWAWDGTRWSFLDSAPAPRRQSHALASDPQGRVVLFGGEDNSGLLADTWIFRSPHWAPGPEDGPPARKRHAMALSGDKIILYGGSGELGPLGDTWWWDGEAWNVHEGSSPPEREGHAMAFDPARERMVMFGGSSAEALLQDTWEWTGEEWIERHPPGLLPDPRLQHVLAYDPARRRVLLFGGASSPSRDTFLGDTWELLAPADQRAAAIISLTPERLGIPLDRIEALSAIVEANEAEVLAWDLYEGRWRADFEQRIERFVDPRGTIHVLIGAAPQTELLLDYFEVTIRYQGTESLR